MKKVLVLIALVLSAAALVACGGDDDDDGDTAATTAPSNGAATGGGGGGGGAGAGGQTLQLSAPADGSLEFNTDELTAQANGITIEFDNPAPVPHNVEVEGPGGEELGVTDTITEDTATLQLSSVDPGEYVFYCNVPGHREGGMEGTLTVR